MSKRKTHEQYVNELLMINPNIEVIGLYTNTHSKILHRCKIDEYEWEARPHDLLRGKGCPICAGTKKKTHEEYVKEVSILNSNIQVVGGYIGNKTPILHKCVIDGCEWYASPTNILKGKGCPKCGLNRRVKLSTRTHDEFVNLLCSINPNIEVIGQYTKAREKIALRCKIDGCEWETTADSVLHGHGCPKCNISRGEKDIVAYLESHEVTFDPQHTFIDCKNVYCLPFDFYLPDYNTCIEYDGVQHFEVIDFFGGEDAFKKRQYNDSIKTTYCRLNGIKLLRIKYDQNIEEELNNFFNNTKLIKEVI